MATTTPDDTTPKLPRVAYWMIEQLQRSRDEFRIIAIFNDEVAAEQFKTANQDERPAFSERRNIVRAISRLSYCRALLSVLGVWDKGREGFCRRDHTRGSAQKVQAMSVPLRAQLEEVNREIAVRTRVYPRWIMEQKITRERAELKMAAMKAVADTLRELIQKHEALPL